MHLLPSCGERFFKDCGRKASEARVAGEAARKAEEAAHDAEEKPTEVVAAAEEAKAEPQVEEKTAEDAPAAEEKAAEAVALAAGRLAEAQALVEALAKGGDLERAEAWAGAADQAGVGRRALLCRRATQSRPRMAVCLARRLPHRHPQHQRQTPPW